MTSRGIEQAKRHMWHCHATNQMGDSQTSSPPHRGPIIERLAANRRDNAFNHYCQRRWAVQSIWSLAMWPHSLSDMTNRVVCSRLTSAAERRQMALITRIHENTTNDARIARLCYLKGIWPRTGSTRERNASDSSQPRWFFESGILMRFHRKS